MRSVEEDVGYRVHVHQKTGTSQHALRKGDEIVFGRDPECRVSLADGQVSRRHATLRLRDQLEIVDLGSRNGTIVDGVRIASNAPAPVRATSVIRIGGAVIVVEEATAFTQSAQWCFDRATFEEQANAMLERSKRTPTSLLEIKWDSDMSRTTTADATTPASLQQMIVRIVGAHGLIGAHESSRLLLLTPDTDETRASATASLIKRVCEERSLKAEVRVASSAQARTIDVLLAICAQQSRDPAGVGVGRSEQPMVLVPPVIFHGGLRSVDALLEKLDASDAPILIVGETGVGKDVLARTLHARSRRKNRPLVSLNCAAFTEALFESELFGHERGAFTGANQAKAGLLESAAGGTVFLDEIGEMPLAMQAKLLRVVENREVLRVGALQPKQIDVRLVFATNRDLRLESEKKTFRSDLFFRIASITLTIPPLRERTSEIVPLARHFIEASAKRMGRLPPRLLPEAAALLESHAWPGNVRELKNVMELATLVQEGEVVRPSDLHIERFVASPASSASRPASSPAPPSNAPMTERERMIDALERSVWNQSNAAKLLGMPRRTFVKRLAQYDIPRPRKKGEGEAAPDLDEPDE